MGTNYYAHLNACPTCHRSDKLHIGKSLHIVRGHPWNEPEPIATFADWRRLLADPTAVVWDEYGQVVAHGGTTEMTEWLDLWTRFAGVDDFLRTDHYAQQYLNHGDRLDPEGYHFCDGEFS